MGIHKILNVSMKLQIHLSPLNGKEHEASKLYENELDAKVMGVGNFEVMPKNLDVP